MKKLTLPAVLLSICLVPAAFSQKENKQDTTAAAPDTIYNALNEVVITGTRVSKKIIDIPYSVVRFNFMDYRYDRKVSASDVMPAVPGLFMQSRYGNHDVRFSIRGFGSRSNSGIRGVRILLDDIPESEPDGQTRIEAIDFNSIGRIEIVKGNASSLYTNAPGGVANFINDIGFHRSSVTQHNQFGSFGLFRNGVKAAVRTKNYGFLTSYTYQNYEGYREHNNEYWHILNMVLETKPSPNTSLKILGYYTNGEIKLPGSLTKEEFDADPWQADPRSVSRDEKRITTKGRLGLRFNAAFGDSLNHEVEITSYGTIKYFDRTAKDYRIINRYGLGVTARYLNKATIFNRHNEFSIGTDIYSQPARTEYYDNIGGAKGDQLRQLYAEDINNVGFYFTENYELAREKLFLLLTGRYDNVTYSQQSETAPVIIDGRTFDAFTPKLALNYKITPWIAAYTSFGLSYDSPANNELDWYDPAYLYNPELQAQESRNFEIGIKGNRLKSEEDVLRKITFEGTFFAITVDNEIIPYVAEDGSVYYRNAGQTHRFGAELGAQVEFIRNLDFIFAYTFSDFKYRSYLSTELDTNGLPEEKDYSGNIVPSVPKNNIFAALSYSHEIFKHLSGFGKLSYNGIGGMWVNDANTDQTEAYHLLNAVLGIDLNFGGFNMMVSGGIDNIFDQIYVGFTNTNGANDRYYEAGAPRNYFLSVNFGYTF
jgi:iron complex outermembrane receptor protein